MFISDIPLRTPVIAIYIGGLICFNGLFTDFCFDERSLMHIVDIMVEFNDVRRLKYKLLT